MSAPLRRLLKVEMLGDTTVVRFVDRKLLGEETCKLIGDELFKLVDELGRRKFILDFENVDYLASAVVGKFLTLNKKLKALGGQLTLRHVNPDIYNFFEVSRLDKLLDIQREPVMEAKSEPGS